MWASKYFFFGFLIILVQAKSVKRSVYPYWAFTPGCCGPPMRYSAALGPFANQRQIMWPMPLATPVFDTISQRMGMKRNFQELNKDNDDLTPYSVSLDTSSKIILNWGVDYKEKEVNFKIVISNDLPDFNWFAVGWSDYGEMTSADLCLLWFSWEDLAYLQDTYTDTDGKMHKDKQNDCLNGQWNKNERILQFSRAFDTCDDEDYIIEDGTTHIVWALGTGGDSSVDLNAKENSVGMVRVQLLKNIDPLPEVPDDAKQVFFLAHQVHVPDDDTTYWCHVHLIPKVITDTPHHIIRYEPLITKGNEGLVHHMELFYCDAPADEEIPSYVGPCFAPDRPQSTKVCSKVRAAWAMGAGPFVYPETAGLRIGGKDSNKYIMLEVHYNNPDKKAGMIDSSGVLIYVTQKLRENDAAIMELGLEYTDKMAIPPRQDFFQISGYCVSKCTDIGLPDNGINVFASQLHTHLTGTKVVTRHFRKGIELPNLNRDNHYSTHFQEIRLLKNPVEILPGDFLITTCDFKTDSREGVTFGGHAISDEMCVNYMHYYPASKLEVCKSSVGTMALQNYFDFFNTSARILIKPSYSMREKYNSIPWNPATVDFLDMLYKDSSISMQCNSSDGSRFPGEWDNFDLDPIKIPLTTLSRDCAK